jgi:tetratricopeptide (TPR) repeat protein
MTSRSVNSPRGLKTPNLRIVGALASFLVPFTVYLVTLAPSLNFEDPMEFAVGLATLGVDHPSGYPLETLAGHLFTYLPFGDIPWRLNVSSAFFAALAAVFIFLFTWEFLSARAGNRGFLAAGSWVAAGLYAFSRSFWPQAVITEVYALNAALFAAALWCGLRCRMRLDVRWFLATVFVVTLAAANHPLSLAATGPLLIYLFWKLRRAAGAYGLLAKAAPLLVLGISIYLYLALRASREPPLHWGNPADLTRFLDHVLRREFGSIYWPRYRYLGFRAAELGKLFLLQYGPGVGLLAAAGLVWTLAKRIPFAGMLAVIAAITGPATLLPLVGLLTPFQTFEINVWYLPFFLVCASFAGGAVVALLNAVRPAKLAAWAAAAFTLLPAYPAAYHWNRTSLHGFYFAAETGRNRLRTFDYRGMVVFPFYGRQGIWTQTYYSFVEWLRRDVVVVDPRNAIQSEIAATSKAPIFIRDPDAAEMWWFDFQGKLLSSAAGRSVYYNTYQPDVAALGWSLETFGPVYRVRWPGEGTAPAPPWNRYEYAGLRAVGERIAERDAPYDLTTYRLWADHYVTYAGYCFARGRDDDALRSLATAERAGAHDARISFFIASVYIHNGYPDRAIPLIAKYLPAMEPYRYDALMYRREYSGFLNDLALAYLIKGDPETARRYYVESVEVSPEQTELAAHLSPEELASAAASLRDKKK